MEGERKWGGGWQQRKGRTERDTYSTRKKKKVQWMDAMLWIEKEDGDKSADSTIFFLRGKYCKGGREHRTCSFSKGVQGRGK